MTTEDLPRFRELIEILCAGFRCEADSMTFEAFWLAMQDQTLSIVERGVMVALTDSDRFPNPAELIGMGGGLRLPMRAALACAEVRKAARRVGFYQSVDFDDPVINATIRTMGGWVKLLTGPEDEQKWKWIEFERIYQGLYRSGVSREQAQPLWGQICCDNMAKGMVQHVPAAVVVLTGLPALPAKLAEVRKQRRLGQRFDAGLVKIGHSVEE